MSAKWLLVMGIVVAVLIAPEGAQGRVPMGTGFTYQGHLTKSGIPVNATADFQFTLWDQSTGIQIGPLISANNLLVEGGLFTVVLDFGAGVFDGNARWLQVAVRSPAGGGTYTTLSPRQEVRPAPHALYASTAGAAGNADTVDGYDAGNAAGQVAVSNGTTCTDLDADTLDGEHASRFPRKRHLSIPAGGGTVVFDIPHYQSFHIVVGEVHASPTKVAFVDCVENDHWIAWVGIDGDGNILRGSAYLFSDTTILTITVPEGTVTLKTPNTYTYTLELTSSHPDVQGMIIWPED